MRRSNLMLLLIAILSAMMAIPGYVAAGACDPGSGCCGSGGSYVGQQLFAVPGAPSQVTYGPAPIPRQNTNVTNAVRSARKVQATQTKNAPMLPSVPQFAVESLEVFTFSHAPCLGTLW